MENNVTTFVVDLLYHFLLHTVHKSINNTMPMFKNENDKAKKQVGKTTKIVTIANKNWGRNKKHPKNILN